MHSRAGRAVRAHGAGDATGLEDASRTISRGSGAVTKLPEEFRDALQGYFEAVEAIEGGEQP